MKSNVRKGILRLTSALSVLGFVIGFFVDVAMWLVEPYGFWGSHLVFGVCVAVGVWGVAGAVWVVHWVVRWIKSGFREAVEDKPKNKDCRWWRVPAILSLALGAIPFTVGVVSLYQATIIRQSIASVITHWARVGAASAVLLQLLAVIWFAAFTIRVLSRRKRQQTTDTLERDQAHLHESEQD